MNAVTKIEVLDAKENHGGVLVKIDGRKCSISTVRWYTDYNNAVYDRKEPQDREERHARAVSLGHPIAWISLESTVICGDRGHYEREDAKWAKATPLSTGSRVEIENVVYEIRPAFNRNFTLVKV